MTQEEADELIKEMTQKSAMYRTLTINGYPDFYSSAPSPSPLSEEDFVALCVKYFGGSFQDLFRKLTKAGYGLYKTSIS